ncbi:S-layer homology domain-containing protein [Brevibacillus sp. HB1.3]|uniref:S-layer homology domain-containing protein n=1 Tax=Brevibacillus sp. HB1.3 TaxID=2738842 RepID=UPI0015525144|nr:S-layer homology domain-containing protein [Brevibacillus sp. HB1.3]NQF13001.1 S-layer homology domain-containing protein [Brevibacillus sp. HB1.3]
MNIRKNMISLSFLALLTVSFAQPSFAATTAFTDLGQSGAKDKILSLQQQGVIKGVDDSKFAPNETITAAQGIQLMVNAFDLSLAAVTFVKAPQATDYFSKADNDAWYAESLIIGSVNGLELPNDLDPNAEWTREQFIHQLMRVMETKGNLPMIKLVPVEIRDDQELIVDYQGSIQRALARDIIELDKENKLHPKKPVTREEAAEMIYNALAYLKSHKPVN